MFPKFRHFFMFALMALPVCAANTTLRLSETEAIRMALEKNLAIQVRSFNPKLADARLLSEKGAFDPQFNAGLTRNELDDKRLGLSTANDSVFSSISGLLPWGATYDLGTDSLWRDKGGVGWDTSLDLTVRQPLLQGFGTDVNLAQIRIARRSKLISEWELRAQVIDTVTEVIFRYNELYQSMENFDVAVRFQDLAQQLLSDNEKRMEIGVMSPLDVTEARAQVAQRKEAVILSRRAIQNNQNFLKQLVTDDVSGFLKTDIEIVRPTMQPAPDLDVEKGISDALQLRPDYRSALLDLEQRQIRVVFTQNRVLPRLDLVASLGLLGVDGAYVSSLDRSLNGRDRESWSAGVQFSIPLGNREARGSAKASKLEEARALVALKQLEQSIIVEVDNAAGAIITARERVTSTRESLRLARETLQAGSERLKAGVGTTFTVLQFQRDLAEAAAAEIRARTDLNQAVAEYERATGTTLGRRNIDVEW